MQCQSYQSTLAKSFILRSKSYLSNVNTIFLNRQLPLCNKTPDTLPLKLMQSSIGVFVRRSGSDLLNDWHATMQAKICKNSLQILKQYHFCNVSEDSILLNCINLISQPISSFFNLEGKCWNQFLLLTRATCKSVETSSALTATSRISFDILEVIRTWSFCSLFVDRREPYLSLNFFSRNRRFFIIRNVFLWGSVTFASTSVACAHICCTVSLTLLSAIKRSVLGPHETVKTG